MTCEHCGSRAKGRLCAECEMLEKMENDVSTGEFYDVPDDGRDYTRPGDCRAIVSTTGKQCTSSPRDSGLCGTHEKTNNLLRVDDVRGAPFTDLRDELVEVGMHGAHAYRLATQFRDAAGLWDRVASLEPIEIGDNLYDGDSLATHGKTIAKLPDLDVDDHPLAFENCIALTDSDKYDGRCINSGYGRGLLCGTHKQANDPDTTLDDSDFDRVEIDGDEYLLVERRDDDVIVVDTDEWRVERIDDAAHATETTDDSDTTMTDATTAHDDAQADENDDQGEPRPPELDGIEEDDTIRVTVDDGEHVIEGDVTDTGTGGWDSDPDVAEFGVYVETEHDAVRDTLLLEAVRDHGDQGDEWSSIAAYDLAYGVDPEDHQRDLGNATEIEQIDEAQKMREELEEQEDWVDPFVFENRVDELESVGLSEREAQVVAVKEQGKTHEQVADFLADFLDRDSVPKSTVDEYSRRARRKIRDARELVDAAGDLYE